MVLSCTWHASFRYSLVNFLFCGMSKSFEQDKVERVALIFRSVVLLGCNREVSDMLDVCILGATVYDGTLNPPRALDVGIADGQICLLGELEDQSAADVIDATGLAVSPGFIDIHSHTDHTIFGCPDADSKIRQGVTVEVVGHSGYSPAPRPQEVSFGEEESKLERDFSRPFERFEEYLAGLDALEHIGNLVPLIGHGTLRETVMGYTQAPPTRKEMNKMQSMLSEALVNGAWGMSAGLDSAPGAYAELEEMVQLAKTVAAHNGLYVTCAWGHGNQFFSAVRQAIEVGSQSGVSVQISHLAAAGSQARRDLQHAIELIESARSRGVDIMWDVYPKSSACTTLASLLPPWVAAGGREHFRKRLEDDTVKTLIRRQMEEGMGDWSSGYRGVGWDKIVIISLPGGNSLCGDSILEVADDRQKDPFDIFYELLLEYEDSLRVMRLHSPSTCFGEVLKHPLSMISSDAEAVKCNPQMVDWPNRGSFSAFPSAISRYLEFHGSCCLAEAIHKATMGPAQRLGMADRGLLRPGKMADLVVFSPDELSAKQSCDSSDCTPLGIYHVLVSGQPVLREGKLTGLTPGKRLAR